MSVKTTRRPERHHLLRVAIQLLLELQGEMNGYQIMRFFETEHGIEIHVAILYEILDGLLREKKVSKRTGEDGRIYWSKSNE